MLPQDGLPRNLGAESEGCPRYKRPGSWGHRLVAAGFTGFLQRIRVARTEPKLGNVPRLVPSSLQAPSRSIGGSWNVGVWEGTSKDRQAIPVFLTRCK